MIQVSIQSILDKLSGNIDFLQPIYETIVNSIEAEATKIDIVLFEDKNNLFDKKTFAPKLNGFKIIDNGIGFNERNRKSFSEYLTKYKSKLGCKGIGRFTWLKVFESITIRSFTKKEKVDIDFNENFAEKSIKVEKFLSNYSKTEIIFQDVQKRFLDSKKDSRPDVNLKEIKTKIEEHLMVNFFLWKKNKKTFTIKLKIEDSIEEAETVNTDIELKEKEFDFCDEKFKLYYNFINNKKNRHLSFYCGNGRTVKSFPDNMRITTNGEDKASSIFLLSSKYFDDRVNDIRNEFTFDLKENNKSLYNPIIIPELNAKLKNIMDEILINRYPQLEKRKDEVINTCIEENPYLAKYIKKHKNDFLLPQKNSILDKAMSEFKEEKENIKNKFIKMLLDKKIDTKKFKENINKISDICNRELAQYFFYRQNIIDALNKLNVQNEQKEKLLHDLFMAMGSFDSNDNENIYNTNIWLLDDKYMSYTHIFSDKKIKTVKKIIKEKNIADGKDSGREPDITIFYNTINNSFNENSYKDVVVVELKAIGANTNDKLVSIEEINTNLGVIAEEIDNIKSLYGYIITYLDDKTIRYIKRQPGVKVLFANGNKPIFYLYNENITDKAEKRSIPCHVYILSTDTLYEDANARNKVFLDIIKNSR